MANVIIPNEERRAEAEHVMKSYGCLLYTSRCV